MMAVLVILGNPWFLLHFQEVKQNYAGACLIAETQSGGISVKESRLSHSSVFSSLSGSTQGPVDLRNVTQIRYIICNHDSHNILFELSNSLKGALITFTCWPQHVIPLHNIVGASSS